MEPMCTYPNQKYHLTTSKYSIMAQVVVNNQKKFVDVYIGLLGFVNDSLVLQKKCLHRQT
jgi:hypothetical protein